MDTYLLGIDLEKGAQPSFPSFTSSHTLVMHAVQEDWLPAGEIVNELEKSGFIVSRQTLFLHEKAGKLTSRRLSARKILFNLQEVKRHFNLNP